MKLFIICFLLFICQITVFSQSNENFKRPEVINPSPNQSEMIRQTEFPVSNYTGTANVSVPIYTIKSGDLTVPITATYNTSGNKVNQEASWIGLGWNLNVGGSVTRVIRGADDLSYFGVNRNFDVIRHLSPFVSGGQQFCRINSSEPDLISVMSFLEWDDGSGNIIGAKRDVFYFNFGNESGQFVLPQYKGGESVESYKPITLDKSNVDIELLLPKKGASTYYNFKITTVNGVKYYFGTSEHSISSSIVTKNTTLDIEKYYGSLNDDFYYHSDPIVSTWLLDSIVSPKKDKIIFEYSKSNYLRSMTSVNSNYSRITTKDEVLKITQNKLQSYYNPDMTLFELPGFMENVYSASVNEEKYLKKIRFKNGEVNLTLEERNDIAPYTDFQNENDFPNSENSLAYSLKKIQIKNTINKSVIKEINFNQDYFNSESKDFYNFHRLKLNSIEIRDVNKKTVMPYNFTYYPGNLPNKESFSIDHWGYFNGKTNKHLIPRNSFKGEDYNVGKIYPANRNVVFDKAKIGMLKSVQYPTKGNVEFEYEPHIYGYKNKLIPKTYKEQVKTLKKDNNEESAVAYAFFSPYNINIEWYVDFSIENVGYSNREDLEFTRMYSGVYLAESDLIEEILPTLNTNLNPSEVTAIKINQSDLIYDIENLFKESNGGEIVKEGLLPKNITFEYSDQFLAQSYSNNLKIEKGRWYFFIATKSNGGIGSELYAKLRYPDTFEKKNIPDYGPGLRIKKQILKSDTGVEEITNYEYETTISRDSMETHGKLIIKPRYHNVYTYADFTMGISRSTSHEDFFVHELSSSSFQDLSSITNKGIMGYEKVRVYKNDNKDNGYKEFKYNVQSLGDNLSVIGPAQLSKVPLVIPYTNGLIKEEVNYDNLNNPTSSKNYYYDYVSKIKYEDLIYMNKHTFLAKPFLHYDGVDDFFLIDSFYNERCHYRDIFAYSHPDHAGFGVQNGYYFYFKELEFYATLLKTVVDKKYFNNVAILTNFTEYKYDNKYFLPIQTTTYDVKNNIEKINKNITSYKYPFNYELSIFHPLSKMKQRDSYQIDNPVEVQYWKQDKESNLKLIGGMRTEYNDDLLPSKIYSINAKESTINAQTTIQKDLLTTITTPGISYDKELTLDYYAKDYLHVNNIKTTQKLSNNTSYFYWGYNKTYPILKLDNISEIDIESIIESISILPQGYNSLENLLLSIDNIATDATQKVRWNTFNNNLRNALPNAMIETYTYAPLIGMTSKTDARGYTTYYEYDEFNRLKHVKDADGNILSKNDYNYKN